jgi:hypothetical protein
MSMTQHQLDATRRTYLHFAYVLTRMERADPPSAVSRWYRHDRYKAGEEETRARDSASRSRASGRLPPV